MGAFNQGWGMRCDGCRDQLSDSIWMLGCRPATKKDAEHEATKDGWKKSKGKWYCIDCFKELGNNGKSK